MGALGLATMIYKKKIFFSSFFENFRKHYSRI